MARPDLSRQKMNSNDFLIYMQSQCESLPRNARRIKEREIDKFRSELKKLTSTQQLFIEKLAQAKAEVRIGDEVQDALSVFNICLSALYIERHEDTTRDEIVEYMDQFNKLLIEEIENNDMWLIKAKGDVKSMTKLVNKEVVGIVEETKRLIAEGKKGKEIKENLAHKFPLISMSKINNTYKKVIEELREQAIKEADKAIDKPEELKSECTEIVQENITHAETVAINTNDEKENMESIEFATETGEVARITPLGYEFKDGIISGDYVTYQKPESISMPQEICVNENKTSKLKVLEKQVKVQGEFGVYEADEEKVCTGKLTFRTIEDIETYRRWELDRLSKMVEELKEVFFISGLAK